jgi:hypothetical protein
MRLQNQLTAGQGKQAIYKEEMKNEIDDIETA